MSASDGRNSETTSKRELFDANWRDSTVVNPKGHMANMMQLAAWFESGKIAPSITETVTLEGTKDALKRLSSRHAMGKIVVKL